MADKEYIERLQMVIDPLHKCASTWVESVPVRHDFRGKALWDGVVEVFELIGHPKAKRAYGWIHRIGPTDQDERFVTVLGLPPVDSAQSAVRVAMVADSQNGNRNG